MMHATSTLDHFPAGLRPREIQREILGRVDEELKSYDKIVISAPTGAGKSPIGVAIASALGSSFIVTASKQLQDQYNADYPTLGVVKGMSNYPCLKLMEQKKIADRVLAMSEKLTCEKGRCQEGKDEDGRKVFCKFKPVLPNATGDDTDYPYSDDKWTRDGSGGSYPRENPNPVPAAPARTDAGGRRGSMCEYYDAKFAALMADHSIWNYYGYFQLMLNRKAYGGYLGKAVSIFDEAHKIEDQILGFVGITVTRKHLDECRINPDIFELGDIDSVLEMLNMMRKAYGEMLRVLEELDPEANFKRRAEYEASLDQVARTGYMVERDKKNYIATRMQDIDKRYDSISIKPIDIGAHVQSFFATKYQVFMSATIDKTSFCQNMGLDASEVGFVDTPKSPFALENRRIQFKDCGAQGMTSPPENRARMLKTINAILDDSPGKRGLILTSSKSRCNDIQNSLSPENRKRVRQCHSYNEGGKTQNQIIQEHAKTPDGVLLSSSLWEGVDLVGDLSRFQIIAKIPYPDLGDKRNRIKRERSPLWFQSQAIMKTLQGCGRSIRGEDDWAETYVLDSAFRRLVQNTRHVIPKAYHDSLGMEQ